RRNPVYRLVQATGQGRWWDEGRVYDKQSVLGSSTKRLAHRYKVIIRVSGKSWDTQLHESMKLCGHVERYWAVMLHSCAFRKHFGQNWFNEHLCDVIPE